MRTCFAGARWWLLFPILALQFAGIALVIPALPGLKLDFFSGDHVATAHMQSIVDTTRAVLTILVSAELGRMADSIGRKPLIFLSVVCTVAPLASLCLTTNLYSYYVLFAMAGALGGQHSPSVSAYVADTCPQETRAKRFGTIGATFGFVFMVLPILGSAISQKFGRVILFRSAVAVVFLAAGFASVLPESLPQSQRRAYTCNFGIAPVVQPLRVLLQKKDRELCMLAIFRFLGSLSRSGKVTVGFFAYKQLVDFSETDIGWYLATNGFASIIGQVCILRVLIRCGVGEVKIMLLASLAGLLQSLCCISLGLWPEKHLIFLAAAMSSGYVIGEPALTAHLTKITKEEVGSLLGTFTAVDGVASFIAPFLFSFVFAAGPLWPFVLSAAFQVMSAVVAASMHGTSQERVFCDEKGADSVLGVEIEEQQG